MTKFTLEVYVDQGVVTKVLKTVDPNFKEPEFVVDTMFAEIPEERGYDRNLMSPISFWKIVDGGKVRLTLTTRKEE